MIPEFAKVTEEKKASSHVSLEVGAASIDASWRKRDDLRRRAFVHAFNGGGD